jgi:hypothetical protein
MVVLQAVSRKKWLYVVDVCEELMLKCMWYVEWLWQFVFVCVWVNAVFFVGVVMYGEVAVYDVFEWLEAGFDGSSG